MIYRRVTNDIVFVHADETIGTLYEPEFSNEEGFKTKKAWQLRQASNRGVEQSSLALVSEILMFFTLGA
ncbi:hypothetical protein ABD77_25345 [Brevibacillus formosus]|nr:hypothetical protein [Brevibacillus formosus]